ncbi:hypothetical protein N7520_007158 [Penicillium odoratum]|uniref:uncharacterized protein n=1 Tax=Penicillium odoratum TaxID=1167516 RepID=UPI002548D8B4|nr:uncharacterized protein N7520_007158 [Penicillium odoratum]KAJ5760002.1 hypothetical protein N7520_007158 [Penicillium odoratum]
MFPEKYNYWYSYFLVGIPVGLAGNIGTVLSIDMNRPALDGSKQKRGSNWCWFTIDQERYLEPGNSPDGLEGKLHSWLKNKGEDPQQWPYAYLVSVPVFLGCTRNAVTWWFLYSATRELNAMVFEANNSFGERHCSFVRLEQVGADIRPDHHVPETRTVPTPTSNKSVMSVQFIDSKPQSKSYKARWTKDFFLSPYEKVEGFLATSCGDPCGAKDSKNGDIKLNTTLQAADGRAKIITRVYPCGSPVDPLSTSAWTLIKFLVGWSYIGALSRPRIIYEALRIRFRGNMPYLKKPQVIRQNIPRDETQLERFLEQYFRLYLSYLTARSPTPLTLTYQPSKSHVLRPEKFFSKSNISSQNPLVKDIPTVTVQALTPSLYTNILQYTDAVIGFTAELNLCPVPATSLSQSLWASDPTVLKQLVESSSLSIVSAPNTQPGPTWTCTIRKALIHLLRGSGRSSPTFMDQFVYDHLSATMQRNYQAALIRILIAERFAVWGSHTMVSGYYFAAKILFISILLRLVHQQFAPIISLGWEDFAIWSSVYVYVHQGVQLLADF